MTGGKGALFFTFQHRKLECLLEDNFTPLHRKLE